MAIHEQMGKAVLMLAMLLSIECMLVRSFIPQSSHHPLSKRNEKSHRIKSLHILYDVEEFGADRRDPMWKERALHWILLVDDEQSIRDAVGKLLFVKGYQVTTCADAWTALNVTRTSTLNPKGETVMNTPDVIVSDIRMPEMDGIDLLKEIRSDKMLVEVPVVLLTAKGLTQDRIVGYNAGADAYIPKPFDPEELVTIIDGLIAKRKILTVREDVGVEELLGDLDEIKRMLLEKGGGGVGNGWVQATNVFLAPDEREVLELLCQGLMNKEIARKTFLSTRRVEALLTSMFRKANVKNRTELVRWAIATGNVQV